MARDEHTNTVRARERWRARESPDEGVEMMGWQFPSTRLFFRAVKHIRRVIGRPWPIRVAGMRKAHALALTLSVFPSSRSTSPLCSFLFCTPTHPSRSPPPSISPCMQFCRFSQCFISFRPCFLSPVPLLSSPGFSYDLTGKGREWDGSVQTVSASYRGQDVQKSKRTFELSAEWSRLNLTRMVLRYLPLVIKAAEADSEGDLRKDSKNTERITSLIGPGSDVRLPTSSWMKWP
ncbi:unnamed protein product [Pleuronectes platessa]|uniref:Uncharacterized protein n=1 Tax=Pleuronectes platessa TaxID=8262 RepID=A0A9N7UE63_PLEPL|nr:unnamed protein product [Pleuronectes platessa]